MPPCYMKRSSLSPLGAGEQTYDQSNYDYKIGAEELRLISATSEVMVILRLHSCLKGQPYHQLARIMVVYFFLSLSSHCCLFSAFLSDTRLLVCSRKLIVCVCVCVCVCACVCACVCRPSIFHPFCNSFFFISLFFALHSRSKLCVNTFKRVQKV